ncbi:MAG: 50S ribosomal protein L3 [Acholeplasmatales bacterium]|jgi:large subunit ribosomal protein L3|nr:50S ribosomal protein L3 [Acholeplasmatales bacterium]
MAKGILGRKLGMTQIFSEEGAVIPVSVIEAGENVILQQKTKEVDGYTATQIGFENLREKLTNKPQVGHVKKANTQPKRFLREIRFDYLENELSSLEVGTALKIEDIFQVGDIVDVQGITKGKGVAGVVKRHHQHRGPETHGSNYHRLPGSMGAIKGKLIGKNLPGHLGTDLVSIQNLKIVALYPEHQVILVSGSIPGPKKGLVVVKTAIKSNVRG